jgi:hypothetical protein
MSTSEREKWGDYLAFGSDVCDRITLKCCNVFVIGYLSLDITAYMRLCLFKASDSSLYDPSSCAIRSYVAIRSNECLKRAKVCLCSARRHYAESAFYLSKG